MNEELFRPSLSDEDNEDIESYNINQLYIVTFLGGVIPTIVLGTKNFQSLKLSKKLASLLFGAGLIVLFAKIIIYGLASIGHINVDSTQLRWGYRIASIILYFTYYMLMRDKYRLHMMVGGHQKPLVNDAIKWIIIGNVIEMVLLLSGKFIIQSIFR